ncbi:hypothetical protein Tdes44962_MAKER01587 [Teratosphaeria destructans]|uniref:Uncharacterized protein n=1 Tax=Teratosphaeria destructans TaxID=418781 RepID=A0A9W7W5Q0_9PEZI|nr:hypothetical protein Tdes44962_MAKER01587 [Teratosphaeria destructans]
MARKNRSKPKQGPVGHRVSNADIELPAYASRIHEIPPEHRPAVKDPDSVSTSKQAEIEAPKNPFADPEAFATGDQDPSADLKNPFAGPPNALFMDPEIASPALNLKGKQTQAKRFCAPSKHTILGLIFTVVLLIACIVAGVVTWKMGRTNSHRDDFECGHDRAGPDCAARFRNGALALDYQKAYSHPPGNLSTRDEYRVSIPEWLRYNCHWLASTSEQPKVGVWECSPKAEGKVAYHDAGEEPGAGVVMYDKAKMHLEPGTWVEKCDEERAARDVRYAAHCWQADQDALLPFGRSEAEVEGVFECGHNHEAPSCFAYYENTAEGESDYVQMATTHANDLVKYFRVNVPNWLRLTCQWVPAGYEQYVYGVTEGAWMCGDRYMSVNISTVVDGWVTRCDREKLFSEENSHCWSVGDDDGVNSSVPTWPTWEQGEDDQPIVDLEDILYGRN